MGGGEEVVRVVFVDYVVVDLNFILGEKKKRERIVVGNIDMLEKVLRRWNV